MEVLYSPKTIKGHDRAFNATVSNTLSFISDSKMNHDEKIESALELAEERIKLLKSLEKKFKKYNLKYKTPIHDNSIEELKNYVSYLESELIVSTVGLNNAERENIIQDSLDMTSEIAKLESVTNYLDIVSREYLSIEEEVAEIAPKEADNKEEVTINFKDIMAQKKKNEVSTVPLEHVEVKVEPSVKVSGPRIIQISDAPEEISEIPVVSHTEIVDTISPDIFKDYDQSEEESLDAASIDDFFANKFLKGESVEEDPKMILKSGHSLASIIEEIYGTEEGFDLESYFAYIYNYSEDNRNALDRKAYEADMEFEEAIYDPYVFTGVVISLPYGKDLEKNKGR